ncbi:uncharacterized protein TNCV_905851 [Trichonephila clavipes]|nr:uncharacterized protein TNCV_905851 [Trichonephila clavipes]
MELTDTTAHVGSKSQLQISTRRSRVELREHHSIRHQMIKDVVFQLPTPTGLALVLAISLRCQSMFRYFTARLEILTLKLGESGATSVVLLITQLKFQITRSMSVEFVTMAFVYNVCTVRTCVVIHKQKFSTHGAPKQTYMLFQNDIPIEVACHRYTLNMQVSSGTKNNSSPNEPSCITLTVSFNGVLLVVTGTWRSPY